MKVAFIGAGNMGEAILAGLYKKHTCVICEARPERRVYLKKKYRCGFAETPALAAVGADVVLLAVKPQDLGVVLVDVGAAFTAARRSRSPLFISIAAGVTTKFIEKALGGKVRVVRTMPNLPAMVQEGVTAVAAGRHATPKDLKTAQDILKSVGSVIIVPEKMINAVTAVSGSGPAYVFLFVECMMNAAHELGFNDGEAKTLVYQTLLGSAHMLAKSPDSAEVLRQKVTSKGGTTQAAIDVFLQRDIFGIYKAALNVAKKRAGELSR